MTATPSDASVDEMVPGDLETARRFGRRIAEVSARLAAAGRAKRGEEVAELAG
jgi:hypothetical protein